MSGQKSVELNQILAQWPQNSVVTSRWLESHGVYRQLVQKYVLGGWIQKIGSGAYQKPGDQVSWQGALTAIQNQLELPIYLGGLALLSLRGYGQHIPAAGKTPLHLYGKKGVELPRWFLKQEWAKYTLYSHKILFPKKPELGLTLLTTENGFELKVSSLERAFFEMIDDLAHLDFEQVYEVCERLTGLRPALIQELVEVCTSIKVKRIFCFVADRTNHSWFKKLNLSKVDLGQGKRIVVSNGSFDSKYKITIPKQYALNNVEMKNEE
jgi:tRNA-binding EMAP/Myf-like protein